MDFLWHKVTEKEKEEIKQQAKEMMNSFEKELKKVESEKVAIAGVERSHQLRDEKAAYCEPEFRKLFFDNVPQKEGDFLSAEKGKWKK